MDFSKLCSGADAAAEKFSDICSAVKRIYALSATEVTCNACSE